MKKSQQYLAGAAVALAVGAYAMPTAAANLINNGSFETGDFTDWTRGGVTTATLVSSTPFNGLSPEDGAFFALLGPEGSDGTLSQTFFDVIGETYTVSYWLASDGNTPNDFGASVGASGIPTQTNIAAQGNTLYQFTFQGTGSDTLTFNFRDDPTFLALDNISISAPAVPEPAAWALMLVGFGTLGAALRRRREAGAAAV